MTSPQQTVYAFCLSHWTLTGDPFEANTIHSSGTLLPSLSVTAHYTASEQLQQLLFCISWSSLSSLWSRHELNSMSIFRIYFPNLIKNIFYLRFKFFMVLKIMFMLLWDATSCKFGMNFAGRPAAPIFRVAVHVDKNTDLTKEVGHVILTLMRWNYWTRMSFGYLKVPELVVTTDSHGKNIFKILCLFVVHFSGTANWLISVALTPLLTPGNIHGLTT